MRRNEEMTGKVLPKGKLPRGIKNFKLPNPGKIPKVRLPKGKKMGI